MDLKYWMGECGLDIFGSGKEKVMNHSHCGNEQSDSIKCDEYLYYTVFSLKVDC